MLTNNRLLYTKYPQKRVHAKQLLIVNTLIKLILRIKLFNNLSTTPTRTIYTLSSK